MNTNSYDNSQSAYAWLESDAFDLYESTDDGKTVINSTNGIHRALISDLSKIESFVEQVIASDTFAYSLESTTNEITGRETVKLKSWPLSKFFTAFNGVEITLLDEYRYSAKVNLFIACSDEMKITSCWFSDPKQFDSIKNKSNYEVFNDFILLIRSKADEQCFKDIEKQQKYTVSRRLKSSRTYVKSLFNRRNKLLVLRVDLSYRKDNSYDVTPKIAKDDFKKLLNNRRCNSSVFEHFDGYIWKLEYGPDKGYHYHVVFFFNGDKVQNDVHWAMTIGEYWKCKITKGRGIYYNCNALKGKYKYIGVGKLGRNDIDKIDHLNNYVIPYLAKTEQYLRAKVFGKDRCFGMGEINRKASNAGRPRKESVSSS